jgi:hypothetical protein
MRVTSGCSNNEKGNSLREISLNQGSCSTLKPLSLSGELVGASLTNRTDSVFTSGSRPGWPCQMSGEMRCDSSRKSILPNAHARPTSS